MPLLLGLALLLDRGLDSLLADDGFADAASILFVFGAAGLDPFALQLAQLDGDLALSVGHLERFGLELNLLDHLLCGLNRLCVLFCSARNGLAALFLSGSGFLDLILVELLLLDVLLCKRLVLLKADLTAVKCIAQNLHILGKVRIQPRILASDLGAQRFELVGGLFGGFCHRAHFGRGLLGRTGHSHHGFNASIAGGFPCAFCSVQRFNPAPANVGLHFLQDVASGCKVARHRCHDGRRHPAERLAHGRKYLDHAKASDVKPLQAGSQHVGNFLEPVALRHAVEEFPGQAGQRRQQVRCHLSSNARQSLPEQVERVVEFLGVFRRFFVHRQAQLAGHFIKFGQRSRTAIQHWDQLSARLAKQFDGKCRLGNAVFITSEAVGHFTQHLPGGLQRTIGISCLHAHCLERIVAVGHCDGQLGHALLQCPGLKARLTVGKLQPGKVFDRDAGFLRQLAHFVGGIHSGLDPRCKRAHAQTSTQPDKSILCS